jgi:hypothetical protein
MYETGFDIETVVRRLKTTYPVEPMLPFQVSLMLAHLHRAESARRR